ncbi:MAG TPA: M48 family metallopeptidase [Vicinamibacterales bacterium]|jgi:Zn-dependent protease with chaperone function
MLFDLPYRHAILVALCVTPAAVSWWSGRSLLALLDDPLLPERLVAHRRRSRTALWCVIAAMIVFGGFENLIWAIPLTLVARAAAGYRLRRALYDERWSFFGFMGGMCRLLVAVGGIRLLLAVAPAMVAASGSRDWIAATAIGALLLLWYRRSAEWFRFVLRAQPLADASLVARFQAIAAVSTAPQPRFEVVDLRGGAIANAVALPSRWGSSVLYTDTLLRLLDADESTAITAHEIAHLEYYDAARLRTLNRAMSALIVGAATAGLLPRLIPVMSILTLEAIWCAVYVLALAWIARDRQRNETASDLRAVQLCGNPDALVRALTKIHTFARLPRRWDTQMEQAASHPSLARRIRAIRGTGSTASDAAAPIVAAPTVAVPPTAETVHSADGRVAVTFADALQWQEADGVLHVLPYSQLTELRVDVRPGGATRLVALERRGRRWEASLDATETARAQAILDRVDVHLAEPAARTHNVPWLQAAGAIVAICAMWAGQFVVAIVAMGASVRSASAFFAAAGAAALGAAALVGRQVIETGSPDGAWPALLLVVFGVALLAGAWRKRDADANRLVNAGMALLALFAAVSVATIVMRGGDAVRLYQASVALPSAAILPIALAAALAVRPQRSWRVTAIPVCLVGLIVGVTGSGTFLHAFGRDPFLVASAPLPTTTLTGSPITDVSIPGMLTDLRLSPHGKRIAVTKYTAGSRSVPHVSVGVPGADLRSVSAADLLFLDDERALVMTIDGARTKLQTMMLDSGAIVWERWIDDVSGGKLAYRRASNQWSVVGTDGDGRTVSVDGTVGGDGTSRRTWNVAEREAFSDAWAVDGDTALRVHRTFGFDPTASGALSLTMAAMLEQTETRVTRVTAKGETPLAVSRLETTCTNDALDGGRIVCMAFDGGRTHILEMSANDGTPEPIGSLGGRFFTARPLREGWLTGWTTAGTHAISMPVQVAVEIATPRVVLFPGELGMQEIAVVGQIAGTLTHEGTSTRVRLYALGR